ncbi:MAG TPA: phospho-N-acetylmuramoyl-pentapeptide-transferase [bacterium]|nr:phospho-N-acetylmuramoyl-pentapeptide-transferase [bacterium]
MGYKVELVRMFVYAVLSFVLTMGLTPLMTYILYKYKVWKKPQKVSSLDKKKTPIYMKLHADKHKRNIPFMAGIVVWVSVAILTFVFNLSREQTYLPLFVMITMGLVGLVDDYLDWKGIGNTKGLSAKMKMLWIVLISVAGAWWFYYKLGWSGIHVPGFGDFDIGWWYMPLFVLVMIASANSVNLTDGLDGLASGLLGLAFGAFGVIAFFQGNLGIAVFCLMMVGALLAFLWFNIPPSRFMMGDAGSLSFGATMGVVAMLTNSALLLPIIGFVFVSETLSVIIQQLSKRFRNGRKIFPSTPVHITFQYIGWPEYKVVMRFWVIGAVMAVLGVALGLLGGNYNITFNF